MSFLSLRRYLWRLVDFSPQSPTAACSSLNVFYTFLIVTIVLCLYLPALLAQQKYTSTDGLPKAFLLSYLTEIKCNKVGYLPLQLDQINFPTTNFNQKILDYPITGGASVTEFCKNKIMLKPLNEHGIQFIIASVLDFFPNASFKQLVWILLGLKIIALTFVTWVLLEIGFNPFLACMSFLVGFQILRTMPYHAYSNYPFLQPGMLSYVALCFYGLSKKWPYHFVAGTLFSGIVGAYTFLLINLRTEYLPLVLLTVIFSCIYLWKHEKKTLSAFYFFFIVSIMTVLLTAHTLIPIHEKIDNQMTTSKVYTQDLQTFGHTAFHPIVLSLGLIPNPVATKEGIVWDDSVGIAIAKRIDPKAVYLTAAYEKVLYQYYLHLWKKYPKEMINIYKLKLQTATQFLNNPAFLQYDFLAYLTYPLSLLAQYGYVLLLFLIFSLLLIPFLKNFSPLQKYLLTLLLLFNLALYFDKTVIYCLYVQTYDGLITYLSIMFNLFWINGMIIFLIKANTSLFFNKDFYGNLSDRWRRLYRQSRRKTTESKKQ